MARKSKSVYKRIEDKELSISETEELLVTLNNELQELYTEKDELEMKQLLEAMKSKGLTINEALAKIGEENSLIENEKSPKIKNKKVEKEVINNTIE